MTQTTAPYKQLRRPTDDRIVAGVCSGVGRYFGIDPTLVRVGFAVLAVVTWGTALIAYPVMWFLMPEEPRPEQPAWTNPADPAWGQAPAYPAAPAFTPPAPASTPPADMPPAPAYVPPAQPEADLPVTPPVDEPTPPAERPTPPAERPAPPADKPPVA